MRGGAEAGIIRGGWGGLLGGGVGAAGRARVPGPAEDTLRPERRDGAPGGGADEPHSASWPASLPEGGQQVLGAEPEVGGGPRRPPGDAESRRGRGEPLFLAPLVPVSGDQTLPACTRPHNHKSGEIRRPSVPAPGGPQGPLSQALPPGAELGGGPTENHGSPTPPLRLRPAPALHPPLQPSLPSSPPSPLTLPGVYVDLHDSETGKEKKKKKELGFVY